MNSLVAFIVANLFHDLVLRTHFGMELTVIDTLKSLIYNQALAGFASPIAKTTIAVLVCAYLRRRGLTVKL